MAVENVVPMERPRRNHYAGPGGMLSERERAAIQALLQGGVAGVAKLLGRDMVAAERYVGELMWGSDARSYLARLLDARVVGLLAPKAMATVSELMDNAASDRTRLAAAQTALQLVGMLGTHAGVGGAAQAAEQAAREARATDLRFEGQSAGELLDKIERLEASLAAPVVIEGAATAPAPDDRLAPGETVEGGW